MASAMSRTRVCTNQAMKGFWSTDTCVH